MSTGYTDCSGIAPTDLIDSRSCGTESCPTYEWESSSWGSCIIHNNVQGKGVRAYQNVLNLGLGVHLNRLRLKNYRIIIK